MFCETDMKLQNLLPFVIKIVKKDSGAPINLKI